TTPASPRKSSGRPATAAGWPTTPVARWPPPPERRTNPTEPHRRRRRPRLRAPSPGVASGLRDGGQPEDRARLPVVRSPPSGGGRSVDEVERRGGDAPAQPAAPAVLAQRGPCGQETADAVHAAAGVGRRAAEVEVLDRRLRPAEAGHRSEHQLLEQ